MLSSSPLLIVCAVLVLIGAVVSAVRLIPNGNGTPNVLGNATSGFTPQRANCGQVELDIFNLGATGTPLQDIFQYLTFNGGQGVNFVSSSIYTLTLPTSIFNGGVDMEIILSSLQGSFATPTGTVGPFAPLIDTISVQLNNGVTITQNFSAAGNNFTFNSSTSPFVGNGSTFTLNNFTVSIAQVFSTTDTNSSCFSQYVIQVTNPVNVTAAVRGDPQFIGLRGQSYQIHGVDGAVYNIISESTYQLNGRFAFLEGPRACPLMPSTAMKSSTCWTHAGSYINELGLKTSDGQQIFIVAGPAHVGFALVTVNGLTATVGDSSDLFAFNTTHEMTLTFAEWTVRVENSDFFINLSSVRVTHLGRLTSHGLLGQTRSNKRHSGSVSAIEGAVDDYVIADNTVFGDSFVFNKFG